MECKAGWVKMDGQCVHAAAAAIALIIGLATMAGYCWYLYKGAYNQMRVFNCLCVSVWVCLGGVDQKRTAARPKTPRRRLLPY